MYNFLFTIYDKAIKEFLFSFVIETETLLSTKDWDIQKLHNFVNGFEFTLLNLKGKNIEYEQAKILNSDIQLIKRVGDPNLLIEATEFLKREIQDIVSYMPEHEIVISVNILTHVSDTKLDDNSYNAKQRLQNIFKTKYWLTYRDGGNEKFRIIDDTISTGINLVRYNSKECFVINRWYSRYTGLPYVPINVLCGMLGYRMSSVEKIFKAAKAAKKQITLIGFGGANANLLYWINEIASWLGLVNVLRIDTVIDDDKLEWHNLHRFPDISETLEPLYYKVDAFKAQSYPCLDVSESITRKTKITAENIDDYLNIDVYNNVIVGAPTIDTRHLIVNNPNRRAKIVFNTHQGSEVSLQINPTSYNTSDLATETYGRIPRSVFFLNQIWSAIKFMEELPHLDDITDTTLNFDYIEASENIVKEPLSRKFKLKLPLQRDLEL